MKASFRAGGRELVVDLSAPVSLAVEIDFSGTGPRHFGAPAPASRPFAVPGFSGEVATGASCNCRTITLTPHCHGTHTESAGHLTAEALDACRVIPAGLLPALLVTAEPVAAAASDESTDPAPQSGDELITRAALERAWPAEGPFAPRAIVVRTRPRGAAGRTDDDARVPPFLSREAAELLVRRGIEHLVIDLPSIDRTHDEGRLTAHRIFFGFAPGRRDLAGALRRHCTVTELARVPETVDDGWYLLELQAPAIAGDAVTSRPLLYRLEGPDT